MAVNLSPIWGAGAQLFDNSGNVLSGGKIYTYAAGTTTPATTYTSSSGITANSNPIILNSAGRVPYEIWLTDGVSYKFVLKDSNDTLIATYDNLIGINSNFIAYTSQQEIQTATAGQTVFNLTTMQYQPATNNLSVFVDGVNQYGPGAQYAYVETDSDTVTFVNGLHVGASVKFTTASPVNSNSVDASNVSYSPATGPVTTVQNELRNLDVAADGVLNPYRRKLIKQIPLRNSVLDGLCTTYSYPNLYPQSFAVDKSQNELFVLFGAPTGGADQNAWIQVYDLTSGAIKTTFTTGDRWKECLIIRYVSSTRYLYTIGLSTVFRIDITNLPANLSTAAKANSYSITAPFSLMAFDGDTFAVQISTLYRGSNRATYDLYNTSFVKTGQIVFPLDIVGTINTYIDEFPKTQGVCAYNGGYAFGIGAAYDTASSTPSDPLSNGKLQGVAVFNGNGDLAVSALCNPEEMRPVFASKIGYTPTVVENEGVYNDNGTVYSLWVNLRLEAASAYSYGITLLQEFSSDADAMDFSPTAKVNRKVLDENRYNSNIFFSGSQLTNPVTGESLTTFAKIFDFMNNANISQYRFSGTGQTITDFNGAAVTTSGKLCEFYLMNTTSAYVVLTGNNTKSMYWIAGLDTTPVQTYQAVQFGGSASAGFEGSIIAAGSLGLNITGRNSTGLSTHQEFWNPNGRVGLISTNESRTQYHINNSSTCVTGGAGSPEGVVSSGVGSIYLRVDGGTGTSLYVKETGGSGNTGWVAK